MSISLLGFKTISSSSEWSGWARFLPSPLWVTIAVPLLLEKRAGVQPSPSLTVVLTDAFPVALGPAAMPTAPTWGTTGGLWVAAGAAALEAVAYALLLGRTGAAIAELSVRG